MTDCVGWNTSNVSAFSMQMQYYVASQLLSDPVFGGQAAAALQLYASMSGGRDGSWQSQVSQFGTGFTGCGCGCIPPPDPVLCKPPSSRGLTKLDADNKGGWPADTLRTAGGYHIVASGGTTWSIYGPHQQFGDKALSQIWGDPHVAESDGTHWDFSKSSDFRLPDGTMISVKTSAEEGHSVSTGLDVQNGDDHFTISSVDQTPKVSDDLHDGLEWRADQVAADPMRDSYRLGGSGTSDVRWFKSNGLVHDGEVTGASFDQATNQYVQTTDPTAQYLVCHGMAPPLGSKAWKDEILGELADIIGTTGDPNFADFAGSWLDELAEDRPMFDGPDPEPRWWIDGSWGGMGNCFKDFDDCCSALGSMGDLLLQMEMMNQLSMSQRAGGQWA
jgi:hypothetical protein